MSRRDDITGRKSLNGYRSSHANNKTKHKFKLNLHRKKFFLEEEGRWITLKVSAATMRTINKNGLAAVLRDAKNRGTLHQEVAYNG
jgi:large subunit ribosomal protein L28